MDDMEGLDEETRLQLEAVRAQIAALQNDIDTFEQSEAQVGREKVEVISSLQTAVDSVERATVQYVEPPREPRLTPRMQEFPRVYSNDMDLFPDRPTAEEAVSGRKRYVRDTAEQVAYPLPHEVLEHEAEFVTVASLFVDFRKGGRQDLRQGNRMFPPVTAPADGDSFLKFL
jgi:hypothetical protein